MRDSHRSRPSGAGLSGAGLASHVGTRYPETVSDVAEIESAIEQLPAEQMREVAAWLEEYQATIQASVAIFSMLDSEERRPA